MQIKVKNTRTHKVAEQFDAAIFGSKSEMINLPLAKQIPVVEGKLVLVECTHLDGLLWKKTKDSPILNIASGSAVGKTLNVYYKPIIIYSCHK